MARSVTGPRLEHDRQADAIYVRLRAGRVHRTDVLDDARTVDYGVDGRPVGVELLSVSRGVNVDDLPEAEAITTLLSRRRIKVYA